MDTHKQWTKPSSQTIALFEELTSVNPDVKQGKLFGAPMASISGNMFAWVHQNRISLRLPETLRHELVQNEEADPVDPLGKRMREYCMLANLVADSPRARELAKASFDYVSLLPPKIKR